ncbi:MAG: phospholipid carrier-dependent glycosyltransferase, partial [Myxococcales bacterium]|nr:phospholipid carrier-dependent glycosyltransferase [Myxococcales bacterium]
RGFDYDVMPEYRENADELFATWNGWSLLDDGTTRGWSIWTSAYRGRIPVTPVRFFGQEANVITPYFEHPPLMHVLVGAAAHLGGAHHYLDAKLRYTRLVPIGLMALATVLMIAVGRRLWPASMAPYVGALLFSVIPSIVLQTRVIKEEDVLVPLLLGAVLFFLRWRDDGRRSRDLWGAAICVGLAPLAKVPAAALIVGVAMLFAAERGGFRSAVQLLGIGIAIGSTLLLYALVIDWDEFLFATRMQSGRAIHWNIFPRFFDVGQINGNRIGRGWTQFLWLSLAATVYARGLRSSAVLTVPTLVYLVAIAVGTGNWTYGWYVVPLYPFLCLAAGDLVVRTWNRPTLFAGLLLLGLLVFYTLNFTLHPTWIRQPSTWPWIRTMVTAATIVGLAPFALAELWRRHAIVLRLCRLALVVIVATASVFGAWTVAHYDVIYESHLEMDVDDWFAR